MRKIVVAKMSRLPNVVGRVDYISNPERQENLLGFYQTPENPTSFWRALHEESQELAGYNRAQMAEHNRIQKALADAGEIRTPDLRYTVEAREIILTLPNDIYGEKDPNEVARFLAEDVKARYGVECAAGVHMNKAGTNLHAHLIVPERKMLEEISESLATRNTYFDAEGKRSTKGKCVDTNGELLPGCRLVRKGERLHQRRFSEKDPRFASKNFCRSEKLHYAEIFNEWSSDQWFVYDHARDPHLRMLNLKRGEPAGLRAWKEEENRKRQLYNDCIDRMLENGLTIEQAMAMKKRFYEQMAREKDARKRRREEQERLWEKAQADRRAAWNETQLICYNSAGEPRSLLGMIVMTALVLTGVWSDGMNLPDDDLVIEGLEPLDVAPTITAKRDWYLQAMIDEVAIAAGRKAPSQILEERKAAQLSAAADRKPSIGDQIAGAEAIRSETPKITHNRPIDRER